MSKQWYTGTPRFYQGNNPPSSQEAISIDAYNYGVLSFFWDRLNCKLLFLINIDAGNNNAQTWTGYPGDATNLLYPSVLPILGDKLGWFVSDDDPTSNEPIPINFFDGTYGVLWWTKVAGKLFRLSAYSDNGDGTFNQTWTQIVPVPVL